MRKGRSDGYLYGREEPTASGDGRARVARDREREPTVIRPLGPYAAE
jgi:hypothetical protein